LPVLIAAADENAQRRFFLHRKHPQLEHAVRLRPGRARVLLWCDQHDVRSIGRRLVS
jgi:hypothetical protein